MTLLVVLLTWASLHVQYRIYLTGRAEDRRSHRKETESSVFSP